MINQKRIIKNFIEMAEISSPSLNEKEMAEYLLQKLKSLDLEILEDGSNKIPNGNCGNIIARLPGSGDSIMFSAHLDTVTPCENIKAIENKNIIQSKGDTILGGDDKAGIAAIIEMIEVIRENDIPHPDIFLVFSVAEEIGLKGAREIELEKYSDIKYGFVLDASGSPGTVAIQAPYQDEIKLRFIGKAAHAGIEPEKGINALYMASKAISKLEMGQIDELSTLNLGIVKGGSATNIVMEELFIKGESRSFSEKRLGENVEKVIEISRNTAEKFGGNLDYEITRQYNGFKLKEDSKILKLIKKSSQNINLDFITEKSGGGSDTNIYNELGIPTANLGIGMKKVHSTEENILKKDLIDSSRLILEITKEYYKQ
ncbi:MAG: M20/M25/M40 family metallo-hydrolase [Fusobacteriota bacterium]